MSESSRELKQFYNNQKIDHPTALLHTEKCMSSMAEALVPLIIFIVQHTDKDRNGYYYIRKNLARVATNQNNQDYQSVKIAFDELYDQSIHINIFREDKTIDEYEERLLQGKMKNTKRGVLGFKLNPDLESKIKNPRVFARYSIVFLLLLNGKKGAFRFYSYFADILSRSGMEKKEIVIAYRGIQTIHGDYGNKLYDF